MLLAKVVVPELMRPHWDASLRLAASRVPHERLVTIDARIRKAAERPVIVSGTGVIDRGRVFVSEVFVPACARLGISNQPSRPHTPTDKGVVESTLGSLKTLFAQHVAAHTGADPTRRTLAPAGATEAEIARAPDELTHAQTGPQDEASVRAPPPPRPRTDPSCPPRSTGSTSTSTYPQPIPRRARE